MPSPPLVPLLVVDALGSVAFSNFFVYVAVWGKERLHATDTQLGIAFQLANFIRDVGEDLERGRVYLPLDELAGFGVTRADLDAAVRTIAGSARSMGITVEGLSK